MDEATLVLPLAGVIDIAAERARLGRDVARATDEVDKLERKLDNADFVSRAKPEVVEENRERLVAAREQLARLRAALGRIAP
jgi:valyl-tRNA synthetase